MLGYETEYGLAPWRRASAAPCCTIQTSTQGLGLARTIATPITAKQTSRNKKRACISEARRCSQRYVESTTSPPSANQRNPARARGSAYKVGLPRSWEAKPQTNTA